MWKLQTILLIFTLFKNIHAKVFTKCEIASKLQEAKVPEPDWASWLCVAEKGSRLNSSSIQESYPPQSNKACGSYRYGLFQLNSETCNDPSNGPDCKNQLCLRISCSVAIPFLGYDYGPLVFLNPFIEDDIACVKQLWDIGKYEQIEISYPECKNVPKITFDSLKCLKPEVSRNTNTILISVVSSLIFVVIVSIALYLWFRHKTQNTVLTLQEIKDFKYGLREEAGLSGISPFDRHTSVRLQYGTIKNDHDPSSNPIAKAYDKKYEIPPDQFQINSAELLGSGAYGVVSKGVVHGEDVAVKTVKPGSNKEYVLSLLDEIKVMIHIGKHENIVQLVGASTKYLRQGQKEHHRGDLVAINNVKNAYNYDPTGIVYVFVEYCELGSLEKFMRAHRDNFVDQTYLDEFPQPNYMVENPQRYEITPQRSAITTKDLLSFSYQISKGMEFLGSKKVIHADLAARNVLLSFGKLVKISDFGLSRKLYAYCNYQKTKQDPLPWRWMAIESLRDMTFSPKSDVWSFGVTLWEIYSLAEIPFPGLHWDVDFVNELSRGLRMSKPRYSTTKLYQDTMVQCWNDQPDLRPSFTQLQIHFKSILESSFSNEYLSVDEMNKSK